MWRNNRNRGFARTEGGLSVRLRDFSRMAVILLGGMLLLPIITMLYFILYVRNTFYMLAYEYAKCG